MNAHYGMRLVRFAARHWCRYAPRSVSQIALSQTAGSTTTKYGYDNDNQLCRSAVTTASYTRCTPAAGATLYHDDGAAGA